MPSASYLLAGVAIAAAITFALRLAPFAVAGTLRGSPLLADFGRWMPMGAVVVLALYCIAQVDFSASSHGVPQVVAVAATIAVHRWRANAVLSIMAGTGTCVALSYLLG